MQLAGSESIRVRAVLMIPAMVQGPVLEGFASHDRDGSESFMSRLADWAKRRLKKFQNTDRAERGHALPKV